MDVRIRWNVANEYEYDSSFILYHTLPRYAAGIITEFTGRGVAILELPPCSPDLNRTEKVWCWIKDYVQRYFLERMSYGNLRKAIKKAREAVPDGSIMNQLLQCPRPRRLLMVGEGIQDINYIIFM